jgi:hypothetical protein
MKLDFDISAVEPSAPMDSAPLPAGIYTVEITNSEVRALKSGNGEGLSVEYTVIDPQPYAKRKVWSNLNIVHSSPKAETIGRQQLAALCQAAGIDRLQDTDELFGRILRIQTVVDEREGYKPRAEVKAWLPAGVKGPNTPAPAAPVPAARPAQPWARKAA